MRNTNSKLKPVNYYSLLNEMCKNDEWARTIATTLVEQGGIEIKGGSEFDHVRECFDRMLEWRGGEIEKEKRDTYNALRKQIGCTAFGMRSEGDTKIRWWVFPRGMTEEEILGKLWQAGIQAYGTNWTSAFDCTGRWFAGPARISREQGQRTLVTQTWGLDV